MNNEISWRQLLEQKRSGQKISGGKSNFGQEREIEKHRAGQVTDDQFGNRYYREVHKAPFRNRGSNPGKVSR